MIEYNFVTSCLILVPAILAGVFFKKRPELRVFSYYLFVASIAEGTFVYTGLNYINNWWILDIYCVVEYFLLGFWFFLIIESVKKSLCGRIIFLIVGLVISSLSIWQPLYSLYNVHLQNLALFILAGIVLVTLLLNEREMFSHKSAVFWFAGANFIRFACLSLIFTLSTFLKDVNDFANGFYFVYLLSSVNLLTYILLIIGYLCNSKVGKAH